MEGENTRDSAENSHEVVIPFSTLAHYYNHPNIIAITKTKQVLI